MKKKPTNQKVITPRPTCSATDHNFFATSVTRWTNYIACSKCGEMREIG